MAVTIRPTTRPLRLFQEEPTTTERVKLQKTRYRSGHFTVQPMYILLLMATGELFKWAAFQTRTLHSQSRMAPPIPVSQIALTGQTIPCTIQTSINGF